MSSRVEKFEKETVPELMKTAEQLVNVIYVKGTARGKPNNASSDRSELWACTFIEALRRKQIPFTLMAGGAVAEFHHNEHGRTVIRTGITTPPDDEKGTLPLWREFYESPPGVMTGTLLRFLRVGRSKVITAIYKSKEKETVYGMTNHERHWFIFNKRFLTGGHDNPDAGVPFSGDYKDFYSSDFLMVDPFHWAAPYIIPGAIKSKASGSCVSEDPDTSEMLCPDNMVKKARVLCMSNPIASQQYVNDPHEVAYFYTVVMREVRHDNPSLFPTNWINKED